MSCPTKAQGRFSETEIDEEVVVMNLDSGDFFSLTGTAREIWRLIDGSRDRAALIAALAESFDASPAQLATDLDPFLDQLHRAGLIVEA